MTSDGRPERLRTYRRIMFHLNGPLPRWRIMAILNDEKEGTNDPFLRLKLLEAMEAVDDHLDGDMIERHIVRPYLHEEAVAV